MQRPRLVPCDDGSWLVRVEVATGMTALYRGKTPGAAIIEAAAHVPARWCSACAGSGVSRSWPGHGLTEPCPTCEGSGLGRATQGF